MEEVLLFWEVRILHCFFKVFSSFSEIAFHCSLEGCVVSIKEIAVVDWKG